MTTPAHQRARALLGKIDELPREYDEKYVVMIAAALQEEIESCAKVVETWAQDNETIQPSFTKIARAIREGR